MNICLVFPRSTFLIDPMVYPPLGLWYIGAQLEAQGHTTDFRDLSVDDFPNDGDFDQVWISATSPQMHEARRLAAVTRDWTRTKTVFGGAAPWTNLDECARLGFDLTVSGESDHPDTIHQILEGRGHLSTSLTPGPLSWTLPPIRRWDTKYHATLEDAGGTAHRTTTLFTSRGCPMACAFCESGRNGVIWDRFVRYEPVELVARQLRESAERGHTGVMFYDDILPLNRPRTAAILALMKEYGFVWRCFLRTDVIIKQGGFDYLREMAEAGLVEVLAGIESADNRIKANVHKGTTIEQDTLVRQWCKQLGIRFKASFILGLPGEDAESMQRTREWIFTHRPDRADVNALIPFPGTPIVRAADYMGLKFDLRWEEELPEEFWYKGPRDQSNVIVSTSHLSAAQIKSFRDSLVAEMQAAGIPY